MTVFLLHPPPRSNKSIQLQRCTATTSGLGSRKLTAAKAFMFKEDYHAGKPQSRFYATIRPQPHTKHGGTIVSPLLSPGSSFVRSFIHRIGWVSFSCQSACSGWTDVKNTSKANGMYYPDMFYYVYHPTVPAKEAEGWGE